MEIAGAAAPGTDRKLSRQMRFGTGCESRDLLMPYMHPLDLALTADRIGQSIQAVADDAVNPLHAGDGEGFRKLVGNCFGHDCSSSMRSMHGPRNLLLSFVANGRRRQADRCSRSGFFLDDYCK